MPTETYLELKKIGKSKREKESTFRRKKGTAVKTLKPSQGKLPHKTSISKEEHRVAFQHIRLWNRSFR